MKICKDCKFYEFSMYNFHGRSEYLLFCSNRIVKNNVNVESGDSPKVFTPAPDFGCNQWKGKELHV